MGFPLKFITLQNYFMSETYFREKPYLTFATIHNSIFIFKFKV